MNQLLKVNKKQIRSSIVFFVCSLAIIIDVEESDPPKQEPFIVLGAADGDKRTPT